jgi:hypothetical protein
MPSRPPAAIFGKKRRNLTESAFVSNLLKLILNQEGEQAVTEITPLTQKPFLYKVLLSVVTFPLLPISPENSLKF